jgi:hypothetical protein
MNVTYQEQRHDLTTDEGKTERHQEREQRRGVHLSITT